MTLERYQILNDGPGRWVLVDNQSDEPCPVYMSRAEAELALRERIAEDQQ